MATLTLTDQKRIEAIVDDIKLKTGFSYPEKNLLDLAEAEGIKVFEADLSSIGSNISGVLEYEDNKTKKTPKIFINTNISKNRKVFTLAHELGHHFLHEGRKLRLDTLDYSRDDKDTKDESEANYFAASILVPKDQLNFRLKKGDSLKELSSYFGVSEAVITNRLKWIRNNRI